jgi:hypothetical protein
VISPGHGGSGLVASCDGLCGHEERTPLSERSLLIQWLREHGWQVSIWSGKMELLCPSCVDEAGAGAPP